MPSCSAPTTPVAVTVGIHGRDVRDLHLGGRVRIRPLGAGEDAPLRQVFEGLSPRSRFLRYQRAAPVLSASMVRALVDLRPGLHVALAAELRGEPVGIVRWIRTAPDDAAPDDAAPREAEIAVEVIDEAQGNGIGRRLTAAAAHSALDAGIEWFTFWVHGHHGGLRQRLLSLGAQATADDPDQFRLTPTALLIGSAA